MKILKYQQISRKLKSSKTVEKSADFDENMKKSANFKKTQKEILRLMFFERGEEVFDYHYNQQEKRFLTLKHFYGVPMMIGDRWSTIFLKNVFFSFSAPFGAPPVATMIIL